MTVGVPSPWKVHSHRDTSSRACTSVAGPLPLRGWVDGGRGGPDGGVLGLAAGESVHGLLDDLAATPLRITLVPNQPLLTRYYSGSEVG